jgi:hypothetical protein
VVLEKNRPEFVESVSDVTISEDEAATIAERRAERAEMLKKMLDGQWPGVDARTAATAVDAALADAEIHGVGFPVIARGDDGWAETPLGQTVDGSWKEGFDDYLVAMVTDDRRG